MKNEKDDPLGIRKKNEVEITGWDPTTGTHVNPTGGEGGPQRIRCKTCDGGTLVLRKKYRLSGVVVTIGYILLIPSIIGILFSLFLLLGTASASTLADDKVKSEAAAKLRKSNVEESILHKVLSSAQLSQAEQSKLTPRQRERVEEVRGSLSATKVGTGAGAIFIGGFALFLGVSSFVGGLLGWLLVMKKKVLQCNKCETVIAAS